MLVFFLDVCGTRPPSAAPSIIFQRILLLSVALSLSLSLSLSLFPLLSVSLLFVGWAPYFLTHLLIYLQVNIFGGLCHRMTTESEASAARAQTRDQSLDLKMNYAHCGQAFICACRWERAHVANKDGPSVQIIPLQRLITTRVALSPDQHAFRDNSSRVRVEKRNKEPIWYSKLSELRHDLP